MRGLSEIAAAILMTAIVLAAGAMIIAALVSWYTMLSSTMGQEEARYSVAVSQALTIAAAYINSTDYIIAVIVTGPSPVTLYAIYVDEQLVPNATLVSDEGVVIVPGDKPVTLQPNKAYIFTHPATAARHLVKVVYEGGADARIAEKM